MQLKDDKGVKLYPVTSSACVGMSGGTGGLDAYLAKNAVQDITFEGLMSPTGTGSDAVPSLNFKCYRVGTAAQNVGYVFRMGAGSNPLNVRDLFITAATPETVNTAAPAIGDKVRTYQRTYDSTFTGGNGWSPWEELCPAPEPEVPETDWAGMDAIDEPSNAPAGFYKVMRDGEAAGTLQCFLIPQRGAFAQLLCTCAFFNAEAGTLDPGTSTDGTPRLYARQVVTTTGGESEEETEWSPWQPLHGPATTQQDGLMTAADKKKLDGLSALAAVRWSGLCVEGATLDEGVPYEPANPVVLVTEGGEPKTFAVPNGDGTYCYWWANEGTDSAGRRIPPASEFMQPGMRFLPNTLYVSEGEAAGLDHPPLLGLPAGIWMADRDGTLQPLLQLPAPQEGTEALKAEVAALKAEVETLKEALSIKN